MTWATACNAVSYVCVRVSISGASQLRPSSEVAPPLATTIPSITVIPGSGDLSDLKGLMMNTCHSLEHDVSYSLLW